MFRKKIEPLCKKCISKKLLLELTKECLFTGGGNLIVALWMDQYLRSFQINTCVKWNLMLYPPCMFHTRYVDDTFVHRKKYMRDTLFDGLNSYRQNIKLTREVNSLKFLDKELIRKLKKKTNKFAVHWSSQIPTR